MSEGVLSDGGLDDGGAWSTAMNSLSAGGSGLRVDVAVIGGVSVVGSIPWRRRDRCRCWIFFIWMENVWGSVP